jgi:hypothetical protein
MTKTEKMIKVLSDKYLTFGYEMVRDLLDSDGDYEVDGKWLKSSLKTKPPTLRDIKPAPWGCYEDKIIPYTKCKILDKNTIVINHGTYTPPVNNTFMSSSGFYSWTMDFEVKVHAKFLLPFLERLLFIYAGEIRMEEEEIARLKRQQEIFQKLLDGESQDDILG